MATDSIITLERLSCNSESDGTGHSEPYIWPILLWIDDDTLSTPSLVGMTTPAIGNARIVIKNDMRAGESVDIPGSVGNVLRVRFEDGLSIRRLILAVALWENDETPEAAMRAGFQAFSSELRTSVAENIFTLGQSSDEEQDMIIETIKTRVANKVRSAIQNRLTVSQKIRVLAGTLNLDDIVGSAFKGFSELVSSEITLSFGEGTSNDYQIHGKLIIQPVIVDRCQNEINAVKDAQSAVNSIDGQIKLLQAELQNASTSEKPIIIAEIKRIRREELPILIESLEGARRDLQACRERTTPVVFNPSSIINFGLTP